MPTFATTRQFQRDHRKLTSAQKQAFKIAVQHFVRDLRTGRFRKGLRIKRIQGAEGIFEMTWADDGRATFEYGTTVVEGEPHVIWRRVGTHDVFGSP